MNNNQLMKYGEKIIRVLGVRANRVFIIDCTKPSVPKWIDSDCIAEYVPCPEQELGTIENIDDLGPNDRRRAHERFTLIAGILPVLSDKPLRCSAIAQTADEKKISRQTVCNYLWQYLVYQNVAALAPKVRTGRQSLTADEKNFRWALNKFFYTPNKCSLNTAYTEMLKERYCGQSGKLSEPFPSFYQFRYYYRKTRKMQNYCISRNGIRHYQRNNRPLLGDGIQDFAPAVGVGMLDATVCDIYLVGRDGNLVGRPILTACVDAYSSLCCGYSLSWEGGVYSLRGLMANVIEDKVSMCKKRGISILPEEWNCHALPGTLVTDMGKEYVSDTFEQITGLGVTLVSLPPYRPELKGAVEKFFDIIQQLFRPALKGKGVIEPDFMERGAHDYRKDACLTIDDFERIIIRCILYYNNQRIISNFPYTERMLSEKIQPCASGIWNYGCAQPGANLIDTDYHTLIMTLLPRVPGKFCRKGLIASGLRYKNNQYTERYLSGGTVTVAYNPEDVSQVWLIENGKYVLFTLIENRFAGKSMSEVETMKAGQKEIESSRVNCSLQGRIELSKHIRAISDSTQCAARKIKDVRENRKREQNETHIDYVRGEKNNE